MAEFGPTFIPAPYEGLDLTVSPHRLPPSRASAYLNFLLHDQDRCQVRGPVLHIAPSGSRFKADGTTPISSHFLSAPAPIEQQLLMLPIEFRASASWWPWRVFDNVAPSNPNDPLAGFPTAYDPTTGTFTKIGGSQGEGPGPQAAQYLGYVFSMGVVRTTGSGQRIAYLGKEHPVTSLIRFGQTATATASVAATLGNAPRATNAIAGYQNRLWAGGGIAPSGTADTVSSNVITNKVLTPNTLYFTNSQNQDPLTLAAWQTLGVTNTLVVGTENGADRIIGLAPTGRYMLILKRNSIWLLTGAGPDTFALKQVSSDGCVDPRSILVVDDAIFYLGPRGLMAFDGADLQLLSERVEPLLVPALNTYGKPQADRSALCSLVAGPDNYIIVTVGTQPLDSASGGTTGTIAFSGMYHIGSGRWGLLSAPGWNPAGTQDGAKSQQVYVGLNGDNVQNLSFFTQPLNVTEAQRARDTGPSGDSIFPVELRTPPFRFASPPKRSKLARSGAEFYHQTVTGTTTTGRFRLQLRHYVVVTGDDAADNLGDQRTLTTREISARDDRAQMLWFQTLPETTDAFVLIDRETGAGTLQNTYRMEFLGAMIEQAAGHQRS